MHYLIALVIAAAIGCASSADPRPKPVEEATTQPSEPVEEDAFREADLTEEKPVDSDIERGREATAAFYAGEVDGLHERFSEEMVSALPAEAWTALQKKLAKDLGKETRLVDESVSEMLDSKIYRRSVYFENAPETLLVVTWGFRKDGTISGFSIRPPGKPAASDKLEYEPKTALRPPFEGTWTVIWGGRTVEENYHAIDPTQRFALDLLVTDQMGRTHKGSRAANENYYAWGKKVVAPGAGKVLVAVDGVEDNTPGKMNPDQVAGNHVLIDHGKGEYSLLAHFQNGTLEVSEGDKVQAGDLLGLVGNSGNSSEPHIHYHLQDSKTPLKGDGLPIVFDAAIVNGQRREAVELTQGMRVRPAP